MRRPIESIMYEIEEEMAERRESNKEPNVSYPHYSKDQLRTLAIRCHELMYQAESRKGK